MTTDLVQGDRVELTVGAPAHGGHCVARLGGPHGRVVFVRHALPGEQVTAEITELHKGFLRADAVEIHVASPDRVTPPCPYAHPGGCGGCDLQHASGDAQLSWKTAVVREQLQRLAGLTPEVRVEALPTASAATRSFAESAAASETAGPALSGETSRLLGWRSRVRYAVDALDRPGLLKHRSHEVVPIDRCRIAHPAIQELDLLQLDWPDAEALEAVATTGGDVAVLARRGSAPTDDPTEAPTGFRTRLRGPAEVTEHADGRTWTLPPEGFWQVHPAAADTLVATVIEMLRPAEGETSWDLYGGAGLFAAALATRTRARTTVVESSPSGVTAARANLADLAGAEVVEARVEAALSRRRVTGPVDLVVLDPPRAGAGAKVVRAVAAAGPRAVAYVACDPASLARDIATFRSLGWELSALRAFDCFPMTQHIECVALLEPGD
ncbi:TRAM domain-containing protein [Actinoplanes sp. NPDC049596]|uniref:class I SAM-dependent RNA methyltransferase n=1 Tax=unclassified Actinoplanes TaxID=2626549 RepID=UPI003412C820